MCFIEHNISAAEWYAAESEFWDVTSVVIYLSTGVVECLKFGKNQTFRVFVTDDV